MQHNGWRLDTVLDPADFRTLPGPRSGSNANILVRPDEAQHPLSCVPSQPGPCRVDSPTHPCRSIFIFGAAVSLTPHHLLAVLHLQLLVRPRTCTTTQVLCMWVNSHVPFGFSLSPFCLEQFFHVSYFTHTFRTRSDWRRKYTMNGYRNHCLAGKFIFCEGLLSHALGYTTVPWYCSNSV